MNLPVTQTNHQLSTLTFDPELTPGARNAVNVCLRIQPNEKVTIITDDATKEIAASIVRELEQLGSTYRAWVLEDLAPRPLRDLPQEIADNLETSEASIFAVQAQANELRSRMQMTDIVNRRHSESSRDGPAGFPYSCENCGWHGFDRGAESLVPLDQDERNH